MSDENVIHVEFRGIHRGSRLVVIDTSGVVLTEEMLLAAFDKMQQNFGRYEEPLHSPRCPRFLLGPTKACRCGADGGLSAIFEDEMQKR